eukprot:365884-Chlamydomonas_euryale.AAC.1
MHARTQHRHGNRVPGNGADARRVLPVRAALRAAVPGKQVPHFRAATPAVRPHQRVPHLCAARGSGRRRDAAGAAAAGCGRRRVRTVHATGRHSWSREPALPRTAAHGARWRQPGRHPHIPARSDGASRLPGRHAFFLTPNPHNTGKKLLEVCVRVPVPHETKSKMLEAC